MEPDVEHQVSFHDSLVNGIEAYHTYTCRASVMNANASVAFPDKWEDWIVRSKTLAGKRYYEPWHLNTLRDLTLASLWSSHHNRAFCILERLSFSKQYLVILIKPPHSKYNKIIFQFCKIIASFMIGDW